MLKKFKLALRCRRAWFALMKGVLPTMEHSVAFSGVEIDTVIDVGANKGQFAVFSKTRWRGCSVIAFEPIYAMAQRARSLLDEHDKVYQMALAAKNGHAKLHVASRPDSSSLLPLGLQARIFSMDEVRVSDVAIRRLDDVIDGKGLIGCVLLKIDVQGAELDVLRGASALLEVINYIYVECSYIELYKGQNLAPEVIEYLRAYGFSVIGRFNEFLNGGEVIQADFLFGRH